MVLKWLIKILRGIIRMVLNMPGGLFGRFFKKSPEDGETDIIYGQNLIPGQPALIQHRFVTGTGNTTDGGDVNWSNTPNITASDNIYASVQLAADAQIIIENEVYLRLSSGLYTSVNRSRGRALPTNEKVRVYGGPNELWGETWTPADINHDNFGAGFGVKVEGGSVSAILKAHHCDFDIPLDAVIQGIEARVEMKFVSAAPTIAYVDSVKLVVYYKEGL